MTNAKRAYELIYRYLKMRARFTKQSFNEQRDLLGLRKAIVNREATFKLISFNPKELQVITADEEAPKFFAAIFRGESMIGMDTDKLSAWQKYILDGGTMPTRYR